MQFNRGEWSELYALLELLDNQDLKIVDDNLEIIDDSTFRVIGLYVQNNNNEYYFDIKGINVDVLKNNKVISNVKKTEIQKYKEVLLEKIIKELPGNGSFPIQEMKYILEKLTEGNKIKSSSTSKEDISAKLKDNKLNTIVNKVGYSIKSSLGSPATLLNASNNTNFKYLIKGLSAEDIEKVNNINTNTKLVDRLKYMKDKNAEIKFDEVISSTMSQNLQMIDSRLPEILADLLLASYEAREKNIGKLLHYVSENIDPGRMCQRVRNLRDQKDLLLQHLILLFSQSHDLHPFLFIIAGVRVAITRPYIMTENDIKKQVQKYLHVAFCRDII